MIRASFTVEDKRGRRYDANHLSVTRQHLEGGSISVLSFESAGVMVQLEAGDVKSVTFSPCGAHWCSECDSSLFSVHGGGINANPPTHRGSDK
jgi:hypothetical protein